jgi:hypothetical protein
MAIKTKTQLKAYFETNDIPTQAQFGDLIDTLHETLAAEAVNATKAYFSASQTADVVNDWRIWGDANGFYLQICTVANAVKGVGTWVTAGTTKKITTVAAGTYDILKSDEILNVTYTATGAVTIDFKTAQFIAGRTIVIKDAGGLAGTNNITLTTEAAQTIDGAATAVINSNYSAINVYCDGTNLFIY